MDTNIIGEKFGKLTVIKASNKRSGNGCILYECKCDCGNTSFVLGRHLKNGHSKSCGCVRKQKLNEQGLKNKLNLVNKKFGRLLVIKYSHSDKYRNAVWECKCDCGNIIKVSSNSLCNGNTSSCGCISRENVNKLRAKNSIDGTNVAILNSIVKNDKSQITKSGVKGVGWDKKRNKWRVYIMFKGKSYHLGYYEDLNKAIEVRKEAEDKYFGEFLENLK